MSLGEEVIAGVGPGGLKDAHEVKILICFALNAVNAPLSREQLAELCTADGVTDYFTFSAAFEELAGMGNLTEEKAGWTLGPLGRETATALQGELPAALRERMEKEGEKLLSRIRREGEIRTEIVPHQNGYHVRCSIQDGELEFLKLSFYAPDLKHAGLVQRRLQERSTEIYRALMKMLT